MRRRGSWRLAAALLVGLSPVTALADEPGQDEHGPTVQQNTNPSWFSRWFGPGSKKPDPKPAAPAKDKTAAHAAEAKEADRIAAQRQREEQALQRRWEVCDRLTEIAQQNNDDALLSEAEKLAEEASQVYAEHMARLASGPAPVPSQASKGDKQNEPTAETGDHRP